MDKIKIAIIGAGERGQYAYIPYISSRTEDVEIVGIAEPILEKREKIVERFNIKPEYEFNTWETLLEKEKFCDAVIICTNDYMHYEPTKKALEKGYNVLLEKPMSNKLDEILKIKELTEIYNDRVFMICHVLRYTPFFNAIKDVIDSGKIGDVITIQYTENVGYFHMAHSFVRGNWRNVEETSPLILAKSCHDLDILLYLTGQKAKKISSFGNLLHFRRENMPKGASDKCVNCSVETECPYSAKSIYTNRLGGWPTGVFYKGNDKDELLKILETSQYGNCVYANDLNGNDTLDNQVTIIEFENGSTATFNLSGFTKEMTRTIKIMGSKGEIRGHMDKAVIEVSTFLDGKTIEVETTFGEERYGHGGGDTNLAKEFVDALISYKKGEQILTRSSAKNSIESHLMAFAAEKSRLEGKAINLIQ